MGTLKNALLKRSMRIVMFFRTKWDPTSETQMDNLLLFSISVFSLVCNFLMMWMLYMVCGPDEGKALQVAFSLTILAAPLLSIILSLKQHRVLIISIGLLFASALVCEIVKGLQGYNYDSVYIIMFLMDFVLFTTFGYFLKCLFSKKSNDKG